jgi:hypothetical protein
MVGLKRFINCVAVLVFFSVSAFANDSPDWNLGNSSFWPDESQKVIRELAQKMNDMSPGQVDEFVSQMRHRHILGNPFWMRLYGTSTADEFVANAVQLARIYHSLRLQNLSTEQSQFVFPALVFIDSPFMADVLPFLEEAHQDYLKALNAQPEFGEIRSLGYRAELAAVVIFARALSLAKEPIDQKILMPEYHSALVEWIQQTSQTVSLHSETRLGLEDALKIGFLALQKSTDPAFRLRPGLQQAIQQIRWSETHKFAADPSSVGRRWLMTLPAAVIATVFASAYHGHDGTLPFWADLILFNSVVVGSVLQTSSARMAYLRRPKTTAETCASLLKKVDRRDGSLSSTSEESQRRL